MKNILLIFIVGVLFIASCAKPYDKKANIEFVKEKHGTAILRMKENWGALPVEMNLDKQTTVTVKDDMRKIKKTYDVIVFTDKYGYPIKHVWVNDNSFYFLCSGPKGTDSYKILYDNGWKD